MKTREQLISKLVKAGIEPDLRQQGRSFVFAIFPIADGKTGDQLGKAALSLKNYFIANFAATEWRSKLTQLTFSPTMVSFGPKMPELEITHKRTGYAIVVQAAINEAEWSVATSKARHSLLVAPLLVSIPRIRSDWLQSSDRDCLKALFERY